MTISHPQIEVKDAASAGWFGAREEAQLPVHHGPEGWSASATAASDSVPEKTGAQVWVRRVRRVLLDLAIVIAAMTTVPILTITLGNGWFWRSELSVGPMHARFHAADASRAFAIPRDASITPLEAGEAFLALQNVPPSKTFPRRDVPGAIATWRSAPITPTMFRRASPQTYNGPSSAKVLEAAAKGFSADEMTYLRTLAAAPAWRAFDRVARAPSMDMIGGQFQLPFLPEATAAAVPFAQFASTREMAYAAVSRAAYHLAIGQRDSAEAVLRSIVSFGFSLTDNSPRLIDQLIGGSIVEIGRNGLEQFYIITRDPRLEAVLAARLDRQRPPVASPEPGPQAGSPTVEQMRLQLLDRVANPLELRGVRYQSLRLLSESSCTNVRELLFGPRVDVRNAFERAKSDLARYPSERELIDLIERTSNPTFPLEPQLSSPVRRFLIGTSTIAGAVLHNDRLAACTAIATEGKLNY